MDAVENVIIQNAPPTQQTNLNALVAKKETPTETQKTEDKTADPFVKLKIELRKMGVNHEEAKAFIEAQNIQPEDIAIVSSAKWICYKVLPTHTKPNSKPKTRKSKI